MQTISIKAQVMLAPFQGVLYKVLSAPTLTTTVISAIAPTTASCGGDVTLAGASSVTAKGVCWDISTGPTTALTTITNDGTGTGSFSSSITGLTSGTTYYVRAYATNSSGTAYGNELSFTTFVNIGDSYLGGKVAYLFKSGDIGYDPNVQHGMIVTGNLGTGTLWSNNNNNLNTTSQNYGTGQANTTTIVNDQGAGTYAASVCDNYSVVGADGVTYSDWYLPSYNELNAIYAAKGAIGGLGTIYYWSSSQAVNTTAYAKSFNTGLKQAYAKNSNFIGVIAARTF